MSAEMAAVALLNERFLTDYPQEAARALESLNSDGLIAAMRTRSATAQLQTWQYMAPDRAAEVLEKLPAESAQRLLADADPHVSVAALAFLDTSRCDALVATLPEQVVRELRQLMQYPERSAARMMDPRIGALSAGCTVAEAVERLRSIRGRGLRDLFVVDDQMQLVGQVDLEDLVLSGRERPIREVTRPVTTFVRDTDRVGKVVEVQRQHSLSVLPVVNAAGRLVGVIHQPELMAAARLESSMDLQTIAGAGANESALSSAGSAIRARLPWLELNLVATFLAAAAAGLFESTLAQFTVLAVLLPVVAGQSGIVGAQALAVTLRGLVTREMHPRQWASVALKEVAAGLFNGVVVAVTAALGVYIWSKSAGLALIIGVSMLISTLIAAIAGALVPILLRSVGRNPARASTLLVIAITDVVGILAFLGTATVLGAYGIPA